MDKEQLIKKNGNKIFRPLGIIQLLFLVLIISSPFVWIWHSWSLACKLGLTGILGVLVTKWIYSFIKECISEVIEEHVKKEDPKSGKSEFQQKLEKALEKAKSESQVKT